MIEINEVFTNDNVRKVTKKYPRSNEKCPRSNDEMPEK